RPPPTTPLLPTRRSSDLNTQFALAACQQAWDDAKLDRSKLDLDRAGIYLGSGEGSLDFDAFTTANLSAWNPQINGLDMVRWGERSEEHTSELQSQSNLVC